MVVAVMRRKVCDVTKRKRERRNCEEVRRKERNHRESARWRGRKKERRPGRENERKNEKKNPKARGKELQEKRLAVRKDTSGLRESAVAPCRLRRFLGSEDC